MKVLCGLCVKTKKNKKQNKKTKMQGKKNQRKEEGNGREKKTLKPQFIFQTEKMSANRPLSWPSVPFPGLMTPRLISPQHNTARFNRTATFR